MIVTFIMVVLFIYAVLVAREHAKDWQERDPGSWEYTEKDYVPAGIVIPICVVEMPDFVQEYVMECKADSLLRVIKYCPFTDGQWSVIGNFAH